MRKLLPHSWKLLAFVAIASTASADIVVLRPGTIVLDATLTDVDSNTQESVTYVYAWAHSVDSGLQATASASGSSIKLSVEGGQSYRRYLRASGTWGSIYLYHNDPAPVGAGEIVTDSYHYDTARVVADISVIGGTARQVRVYTSASEGQESYSGSQGGSLNAASGRISTPMILDTSVTVQINADLQTTGGVAVTRTYSQMIDLSSGSVTVPVTFDLSDVTSSTLQGTASIPAPFDSLLSRHTLQVYQGSWRYKNLQNNGPFAFTDLSAGNAYSYGYTYLNQPFYRLRHPYQNITMPAAGTATRDYIVNSMGIARASILVDGFLDNTKLAHSSLLVEGVGVTSAAGYQGSDDASGNGGQLDLALPAGSWYTREYQAQFRETATPADYLNSYVKATLYNQGTWSIASGDDIDLGDIPMTTLQTDLIFDVVEPAGVTDEYDISNPYLYGYSKQYDELGLLEKQVRLDAYGASEKRHVSTLRVVGEPGTYQVNPRAYVYEPGNPTPSLVTFPSFELSMEAAPTPVCDPAAGECPVQVALAGGQVVLTFDQVDAVGLTTVAESPVGPEPPTNFLVHTKGNTTSYYYIQTSATFSGSVEVCFQGSPEQLQLLRVGHYNSTTGTWEMLTITKRDRNTNTICALTDSFSPFALLLPANAAPTADAGDDQSFVCLLPNEQVQVNLDGSRSSDPEGDALDYQWSENSMLLTTGVSPTTAMSSGTHVISLEVSDGSQTSAPDTVTITLEEDLEPPTLLLLGDNPSHIECGKTYVEAGATASDECNGDLTARIQASHDVDTSQPGSYEVLYIVTDDAGLSATARREVIVDDTCNSCSVGMTIVGTAADEALNGGSGSDAIYGRDGNDHLHGGACDDELYGENGDDELDGDAGNDFMNGGDGADELDGEEGNDVIHGGAGNDELDGDDGNDLLYGDDGDDELDGDAGEDELYGGNGNDNLDGDAGHDIVDGGAGIDWMHGSDGDDTLYGGADNDVLIGDRGDDTLDGGEGFDRAYYTGSESEYIITNNANGSITIEDTVPDRDGMDILRNVEELHFNSTLPRT